MGNTTTSVPDRISSDRSPDSWGTAGARVHGAALESSGPVGVRAGQFGAAGDVELCVDVLEVGF